MPAQSYGDAMEIDVRTVGGVLAVDRRVVVQDGHLSVHGSGAGEARLLDDAQAARLHHAVARLLALPDVPVQGPADVADDGWTELRLELDGAVLELRVPVAADAPDELWDVLGLVDELSGPVG